MFGFSVAIKNNKSEPSVNQNNWEKEDEKVKKKLERISINSIKYKYAQQQMNQGKPEGFENMDQSMINIGPQTGEPSGSVSPTKIGKNQPL